MACPYFMPAEKDDSGQWNHPARLPLGAGWRGYCTAPGHEGEVPQVEQLDACNLGYARNCLWCPPDRPWDSARFGVSMESDQRIYVCYVREKDHLPVDHGVLEYDLVLTCWNFRHSDCRLQRMAECYLQAYLSRKNANLVNEVVAEPQP